MLLQTTMNTGGAEPFVLPLKSRSQVASVLRIMSIEALEGALKLLRNPRLAADSGATFCPLGEAVSNP